MTNISVTLAQLKPKLGCVDDNLALIEDRIRQAAADKVNLIVFPELALTGYFLKDLVPEVALRIDSPEITHLKELSRQISIAIGQTDEEELGFSYRQVDELLYRMVDQRKTTEELLAEGLEVDFVDDIYKKVQSSHFKRRLPVIAKVSNRIIDRDFRYSRDWGR
jgi:hypothetical protein